MRIDDKQELVVLLRQMADQIEAANDCFVAAQFRERERVPVSSMMRTLDGSIERITVGFMPKTQTISVYLHFPEDGDLIVNAETFLPPNKR